MQYRFATNSDCALLARLNQQLIEDERHRNRMTLAELEDRMVTWLADTYEAILFEEEGSTRGYVLFRREPDHVYLRQFFVSREFRRQGIGRAAIRWLFQNVWNDARRVRLDVLCENRSGIAFWREIGFRDYCLTMEYNLDASPS